MTDKIEARLEIEIEGKPTPERKALFELIDKKLVELCLAAGIEGVVLVIPQEVGPEIVNVCVEGSKWENCLSGLRKWLSRAHICPNCGKPAIEHAQAGTKH